VPAPRVSILLPAWNAGATLGAALRSLHRQTEPRWECIVVDDGSDDDTACIAGEYAAADARLKVVSLPHGGLIAALNAGLHYCEAPLIARMDADDVMYRRRLELQIAALEQDPALAAVGCHVRIFPRRALSSRLREYETWLNSLATPDEVVRDAFIECPVAHPTLMMTRKLAGLRYHDCGWPEDYDLVLRAIAAGLRVGVVPRRLLAWRDHPQSATRRDQRYSVAQFTRCKAHFLAGGFLANVDSYVLWGYGDTGRTLRRALAAHGKHPAHIVEVKASRIGQRIHGAPVIAIENLVEHRGARIVVSVARAGPRAEIRSALGAMQFVEQRDFVCAA
jgi:glycosyltransferase involved in cell wall biosynthesis